MKVVTNSLIIPSDEDHGPEGSTASCILMRWPITPCSFSLCSEVQSSERLEWRLLDNSLGNAECYVLS